MTLQRVDQFTEKDAELNRRIRELESNVAKELERVELGAGLLLVRVTKAGALVRPGQIVVVESPSAIELLLAQPSKAFEGHHLVIIKKGAGNITVRPVGANINGSATASLTTVGSYVVHCADGAYWRRP